ncbi:MAG TPA: thioredoxin family protein [Elusimicrobiota bacterium]|nr:thioredoxin family protein [Elusimicrobiota bacterium]
MTNARRLKRKIPVLALALCVLAAGFAAAPRRARAAGPGDAMPAFAGISQWFNTKKPLTPESLKGKVVLVDFWTYSCVNCLRTLPHLEAWYKRYAPYGFVIVGVHSPEFSFEKQADNVRMALQKYGITYPVAMDNDLKTWDAYENHYWPAHYFIDRKGVIRYVHFGEGDYAQSEGHIRDLLKEGGAKISGAETQLPEAVDFALINSPEMYLGYSRQEYMGNSETIEPGKSRDFKAPAAADYALNHFYLDGRWTVTREFARADKPGAEIILSFDASRANLVLGAEKGPVEAEIFLDGKPETAVNKGQDVRLSRGRATCVISRPRLYNLSHAPYGQHVIVIKFLSPGARAYAFTFG